MDRQIPQEADTATVHIQRGSLGITVQLPVADGFQTDHYIFKADIRQCFHELRMGSDKISSAIADKGFVDLMASDQGNKLPEPFLIIEKIVIHNLDIGT